MALKQWLYEIVVFLLTKIVAIFFREVNQRGAFQIPKSGATIFCICPHANQAGSLSVASLISGRIVCGSVNSAYALQA